ncbi:oxygenase MpaB family protein [Wenjunlia tyrosinilytica]|jgi:uncharacterized protein (DUF2236 family)|uniref:ER-bound oxygenase mpaB/mpaB'/Rubber oxygenase catalytic domain-containing protein n=1 Tax=Wenjunlia tyrosinilytica TaxID=1544741 RepID=A0A917ZXG6_9ACTN|nr:oxygenase MpaB family protein [Wenjunlia tyrosinilytica]GGO97027.1 hypothetical protein GCM10012280_57870 [Wenjunlia tyrosinilytica]
MRDADPGLFGPGSVTWHLHGDPVMWIGGIRALYLQALHPRAVRGVMQNSDFRDDPWGRLWRTASFVGTITYGTTLAAERAGARIRAIHRRLTAEDPDTGETYPVDEPELLLWVHCAEIDSYLHVARRSGFPLTQERCDGYVDEQRASARLVGLDPADVPADTAELATYFDKVRPDLASTPESEQVLEFLREPPAPDWLVPARDVFWRRASRLAYSSLPEHAHTLYGERPLPPPATDRGLRTAGRALRTVPSFLRWQLPPRHIVKAVGRLGPGTHPSAYRLSRQEAG